VDSLILIIFGVTIENKFRKIIMKTRTFLLMLILFIFLPSISANAQKDAFSGEWKINKEKSAVAEQLFLSSITIHLKADSILTTRVYENGNDEEYPFDENLSLDGKDCRIVIFDMPRSSNAKRSESDGSIMISSATTFNGPNGEEDMTAKESWKVDATGKILILEFTNSMSGNEAKGTYYYDKVK
jgi:hypothetical protein